MDALADARPQTTGVVETKSVEDTGSAIGEQLARADIAVPIDGEDTDVIAPCIGDIEEGLVERERQAVRSLEVVGDERHLCGLWIDPVDVARADLAGGLMALVVAVDAVRRVGEPDRSVGSHDDVVRTVQALAIESVGDDGDGSVVLCAADPAVAVLARHEAALAVEGVAVREPR